MKQNTTRHTRGLRYSNGYYTAIAGGYAIITASLTEALLHLADNGEFTKSQYRHGA